MPDLIATRWAVHREIVRDDDVVSEIAAYRVEEAVGVDRDAPVLTEVLAPRLDHEGLDELVRRGEVAEQTPPVCAGSPPVPLDQPHRVGKRLHVVAGHFVHHRHQNRTIGRVRHDGHGRVIARQQPLVEFCDGPEHPASRDSQADDERAGGDDVGDREARCCQRSPCRAAEGNPAGQHEHVQAHPACAHPLGQGSERGHAGAGQGRGPRQATKQHGQTDDPRCSAGALDDERAGQGNRREEHELIVLEPFVEPRADHRGAGGADAEAPEQHAVPAAAQAEATARHDRQQRLQRGGRDGEEGRSIEHQSQGRRMHRVAKPGSHRAAEGFGRRIRLGHRSSPPHEHTDDGEERDRVQQEHPSRAPDGHHEAADRRADCTTHVEGQRTEGEGLTELVRWHEVGLDRLERRECQGRAGAQSEGQRQQAGGRDDIEERHHRQRRCTGEHEQLAADQQAPPVEDVGEGAGWHPDQQDGQHARRRHEGDQERRGPEITHQPGRPDALHERADVRCQLGDEQCPEHGIPQWCPWRSSSLGGLDLGLAHRSQPYARAPGKTSSGTI